MGLTQSLGWEWQVETQILPLSTSQHAAPATGHYLGHSPFFAASLLFEWRSLRALLWIPFWGPKVLYVRVYTCARKHTQRKPTHPTQDCRFCYRARIYKRQLLLQGWSFSRSVLYSLRPENNSNKSRERSNNLVGWMDINIFQCLHLTRLMILSFSTKHFSVFLKPK